MKPPSLRRPSPFVQFVLGVAIASLAFIAAPGHWAGASGGLDGAGNTLVTSSQIAQPFAGHVVMQTTPTSIGTAPGVSGITLYNYGTTPVCCTWTQQDGGALVALDGGNLPLPSPGGPTPCLLDVQLSGTGTAIPGAGFFNVINGKTISCVAGAAQSTDGGDVRFYEE